MTTTTIETLRAVDSLPVDLFSRKVFDGSIAFDEEDGSFISLVNKKLSVSDVLQDSPYDTVVLLFAEDKLNQVFNVFTYDWKKFGGVGVFGSLEAVRSNPLVQAFLAKEVSLKYIARRQATPVVSFGDAGMVDLARVLNTKIKNVGFPVYNDDEVCTRFNTADFSLLELWQDDDLFTFTIPSKMTAMKAKTDSETACFRFQIGYNNLMIGREKLNSPNELFNKDHTLKDAIETDGMIPAKNLIRRFAN